MRAALLLLMLVVPNLAVGQEADTTRQRVQVEAPLFEGETVNGESVQRLSGGVTVRQGETVLKSRQATRFLDQGLILFVGNVVIIERGDTLRAPEVRYDTRTKVGVARGPLRLSDGEVVVTAPRGEYFTREKRATFDEGVQLVDSATVLTSQAGTYFSDEKRAEFAGAVRLDEPSSHLEADSVTYLRETKESFARGNVFIERRGGEDEAASDSTARTFLYGARAYSDETRGFSRVEGDPMLARVRFDTLGVPTDTLLLRAPTLEATRTDSTQAFHAWGGMRLWSSDYAARADSAFSFRTTTDSTTREDVRLFGDPIAWFDRVQINADTLRLVASDGSLDTLFAFSNAFAAERDSVTERFNQLKGRVLTGYFLPDSVRIFDATPNAEAIRQRVKDGQPDGAVEASADRIVLRFRGDVVQRVSVLDGVKSTMYAESIVPATLSLAGFRWRAEERPEKTDLLAPYALPPLGGSEPPATASDPLSRLPPDDADPDQR